MKVKFDSANASFEEPDSFIQIFGQVIFSDGSRAKIMLLFFLLEDFQIREEKPSPELK